MSLLQTGNMKMVETILLYTLKNNLDMLISNQFAEIFQKMLLAEGQYSQS